MFLSSSLRYLQATQWGGDAVSVVNEDMRTWSPPQGLLADIIVSELLGSFGDNELSPECLDGAQRWMKGVAGRDSFPPVSSASFFPCSHFHFFVSFCVCLFT